MDQAPSPSGPKLTPEQILAGIYQPWTGSLAQMGRNLQPDRNYVVWVHVPAQHPMDLRSAEMFRRWALATPLTELSISHNMIAFRCRKPDGSFATGATGMTGSSNLQDAKYLLAGAGVSMFFAVYADGHLNPESEVDGYVAKNLEKRGAIFGAFEVTDGQCEAMQGFLSDFVRHPSRPFERFSNVGDPEKFEGGGCVTFAAALMRKAGILDTVIPRFFRDFYVARYLMGGNLRPQAEVEPPRTPWLKGRRRAVSLNLFWTNPWNSAPADFPGYEHLRQIDPEKMVYTLKQFAGAYLAGERDSSRRVTAARRLAGSPLGERVVVDANNLIDPPNLQYERYVIDDSFDEEMAEMGQVARAWFEEKVHAGFNVRLGSAMAMPVLILERE
jgi:hypothetical protein